MTGRDVPVQSDFPLLFEAFTLRRKTRRTRKIIKAALSMDSCFLTPDVDPDDASSVTAAPAPAAPTDPPPIAFMISLFFHNHTRIAPWGYRLTLLLMDRHKIRSSDADEMRRRRTILHSMTLGNWKKGTDKGRLVGPLWRWICARPVAKTALFVCYSMPLNPLRSRGEERWEEPNNDARGRVSGASSAKGKKLKKLK